jgi:hypothetical protein
MTRSNGLWLSISCGVALGLGLTAAIGATASASGTFTVSPEQLKINQNISSAAVKRSNRSLNYLAPIRTAATDSADDGSGGVKPLSAIPGSGQGWSGAQLAPGQKQFWANVSATGAVTASSGPTSGTGAFTATRSAAGNFVVDFKTNVSACSWSTNPVFTTAPSAPLVGVAAGVANQPTQVNVRIFTTGATATLTDSTFTVQVLC